MKVCVCFNVNDQALLQALEEVPWVVDQDPYSREYTTYVNQAYAHLQKTLKIGTKCGNCQIFIKQVIRDMLERHPPRRLLDARTNGR